MDISTACAIADNVVTIFVTVGGWIVAFVVSWVTWKREEGRKRHDERSQKLDRIQAHLDEFAKLENLYELVSRQSFRLKRDEHGEVERDSDGKLIVVHRTFESNPILLKGLQLSEHTDVHGAIALKALQIHLNMSAISDILFQFEPSGKLKEEFDQLYVILINDASNAVEEGLFERLIDSLRIASLERRDLSTKVEELRTEQKSRN